MNKKGQMVKNFVVAGLIFTMIIAGFTIIPQRSPDGFFTKQGYTMPQSNLTDLDQSAGMQSAVIQMGCDLDPKGAACAGQERQSIIDSGIQAVQGIVKGGFAAFLTIKNTLGFADIILQNLALIIGIDPIIIEAIVSILYFLVFISIILIIYNRIDAG